MTSFQCRSSCDLAVCADSGGCPLKWCPGILRDVEGAYSLSHVYNNHIMTAYSLVILTRRPLFIPDLAMLDIWP